MSCNLEAPETSARKLLILVAEDKDKRTDVLCKYVEDPAAVASTYLGENPELTVVKQIVIDPQVLGTDPSREVIALLATLDDHFAQHNPESEIWIFYTIGIIVAEVVNSLRGKLKKE